MPADRFGRQIDYLRISVIDHCNLRCVYCMPLRGLHFLPSEQLLSAAEIERVARAAVSVGFRKFRLTGGEPTLRPDLVDIVRRIAAVPGALDVAMTTNAVLLPGLAQPLRAAGLTRLNVHVDSLHPERLKRLMRFGSLSEIEAGIAAAEAAGLTPIKLNCVVERGVNDHTVVELARRFRGSGHIVRFIEYMDVGTRNAWDLAKVVPAREIVERIDAELPLEPAEANYRGEVARRWRYRDGAGEIGVIASVSQPFCGDCTRARLTAEGGFVTCLFAAGGRDLKGPLRAGASDAELLELLAGTWQRRSDRYSEERANLPLRAPRRIEMYQVGG